MVVKIRLQRFGAKHHPFYRIVAANAKSKRDGKFLERLGTYNPIPSKDGVKEITADSDRIKYWISVGAQPSERCAWILGKINILPEAPKRFTTKYLQPKEVAKLLAKK